MRLMLLYHAGDGRLLIVYNKTHPPLSLSLSLVAFGMRSQSQADPPSLFLYYQTPDPSKHLPIIIASTTECENAHQTIVTMMRGLC
jgi:hypothetical protein